MRTEAVLAFDQRAFAAGARHRVAVQRTVQPLVRIQLAAGDQLLVQFALQKALAFVRLDREVADLFNLFPPVQALLQVLGHFGQRLLGLQVCG